MTRKRELSRRRALALAALVDGLLRDGFREDEIRGAMGENALRVLGETLPTGPGAAAAPQRGS